MRSLTILRSLAMAAAVSFASSSMAASKNVLFIYVEDLGDYTSARAAREPLSATAIRVSAIRVSP